jgi:hypothetical protein
LREFLTTPAAPRIYWFDFSDSDGAVVAVGNVGASSNSSADWIVT